MDERSVRDILELAVHRSGVDFRAYKLATLVRRIEHRTELTGQRTLAAYLDLLAASPEEIPRLVAALLVKTTEMFRGAATFDVLRTRALPELFARREGEGASELRAWVPACSTGEEAWSLAMCLLEARERAAAAVAVPPELAARWLAPHEQGLEVTAEVRSVVTLARHDLLDPRRPTPRESVFASFDLVSCRNLLIYLRPEAQARVAARLVAACEPGSLLVLDESEAPPRVVAPRLERMAPVSAVYRVR
jgi:two-component system CheB/CheR fusion protein